MIGRRRRRRSAIVLLCAIVTLVGMTLRSGSTDAAWTGRDHLAASVTSAYWPTAGNARAEVGRVSSVNFAVGLLGTGNPLPWAGPAASRTQASPGVSTAATAGPYSTGGVLGVVNQVTSGGAAGGAVSGSVCASYTWGPGSPTPCASATQQVFASGTLSSYLLRANLLLGIGAVDVVSIPSPLSASAACNLSTPTAVNTAVTTTAANKDPGNQGTLQIQGNTVLIPAANGTTTFSYGQGLVSPGVSGSVTSSVTPTATSARSTLVVDGRIRRLNLGLTVLDATFQVVLMDVSCGPDGFAPAPLSAGLAAARVASPEKAEAPETASPTTTTDTTTTAASTTTEAAKTETTTTAPIAASTTTDITTTPEATSTTETAIAEQSTPTIPITTTITTTTPLTTSAEPMPITTFTGSESNLVSSLVTADGRSCIAAESGSVTFSCDDGSSLIFSTNALSASGIAERTVDGLWSPETTTGETVVVSSAVRG